MRRLGFGSPERDEATYVAVVGAYKARYGSDATATAATHRSWFDWALTLGAGVLLVGAIVALADWLRRRRKREAPRAPPPDAEMAGEEKKGLVRSGSSHADFACPNLDIRQGADDAGGGGGSIMPAPTEGGPTADASPTAIAQTRAESPAASGRAVTR